MSNTISYMVKLASGDGSSEIIKASSPQEAAEIFAKSKNLYDLKIYVKHSWLSDAYTFEIPKPEANKSYKPAVQVKPPQLSIVDMALIAKNSITHFPYDQFDEVSEFLEGNHENRRAISELNEKIRHIYREFVSAKFQELTGSTFHSTQPSPTIEKIVDKTMELGVRSVLKKYSESTGTSISPILEGQEIEDKGTWDDIKGRI